MKLENKLYAIEAVSEKVYAARRGIEAKKKELVVMLGSKPGKSIKKLAKKFKGYEDQ